MREFQKGCGHSTGTASLHKPHSSPPMQLPDTPQLCLIMTVSVYALLLKALLGALGNNAAHGHRLLRKTGTLF